MPQYPNFGKKIEGIELVNQKLLKASMKIRSDTLFAKARNISVPVQSYNYRAALVICQDPKATSGRLAEVIAADYGLTLRIFTTVYSAFFSLERKDILSIRYMVVLLGMLNLSNIIIKAPILTKEEENIVILYLGTGLLVSFLARRLADVSGLDTDKAEVCGMLQNIGEVAAAISVPKIVKASLLPDSFVIMRKRFSRMCGGYNPRRLGVQLVRHWNLPELVKMAITPDDFDLNSIAEGDRNIIKLVSLLNNLIKEALSRRALKSHVESVCLDLCDLLKLKMTELDHEFFAAVSDLETKCPIFHKNLKKIGMLDRLLAF